MSIAPSQAPHGTATIADLAIARRELDAGRYQAAAQALAAILVADPQNVEAHFLLGNALQLAGRLGPAIESYLNTLKLNPRHIDACNNLGGALQYQGRLDAAIVAYRQSLALKPDYPEALNNLAGALQLQGKLAESVALYQRALSLRSWYPDASSSLLMALAGSPETSDTAYLEEARRFGSKMLARAKPFTEWLAGSLTESPVRLRVGLVSGELRMNPVGYFLEGVLPHLDSKRVELVAFPTSSREDALTARIRPCFAAWHSIAGLSDEAAARKIREAAPHILLDLAGHTVHNRLPVFAWKPAPVQATWLGYFASTGVPGMDYLVTDRYSLPAGGEHAFSEAPWPLPETRLCFAPPAEAAPVPVAPLPARKNGFITFGSFQRLTKLNDAVLAAWARILAALPSSRLRLQMIEMRWPEARQQLAARFQAAGIDPGRLTILPEAPRPAYLAAHGEIDLILDTFPFPGGTTTCEALWMGVPTITLSGRSLLARQGGSLLRAAGLGDWVADSPEAYVALAIAKANDTETLAALRGRLRTTLPKTPLFDAQRFAGHLQDALEGMWANRSKGT